MFETVNKLDHYPTDDIYLEFTFSRENSLDILEDELYNRKRIQFWQYLTKIKILMR